MAKSGETRSGGLSGKGCVLTRADRRDQAGTDPAGLAPSVPVDTWLVSVQDSA
jgi:hypothetical protein